MQRKSLAALAALTLSGTMVVAWNQKGRLSFGDHLRYVSSAFDASIFLQPDAGPPDSGLDGGVNYEIVVWVSASYGWPFSNQGAPYYSGPQYCSDDASICAYRSWDGSIGPAVELDAGSPPAFAITPQVGAIQALGRALDTPVILVDCAFPGAPVALYNLTNCGFFPRLDDAVALAVDAGATPRIGIMTDNSGGFNEARSGQPFSSYISALEVHRTAIRDHIALRADAGVAGWGGPHPLDFALNSGTAQQYGSGIAQHPYAADFVEYTSDAGTNSSLCGELYFVETGPDNLHPDQAGGIAMADLYGRCWSRMARGTPTFASAVLTDVDVLSETQIRATFYLPCRSEGTCLDAVPISVDTTNVVLQQAVGNVNTYGFHFYSGATEQTPGVATSAVPEACAGGSQYCTVLVTFANMPASFDSISYADTALVGSAVSPTNPRGGGGNFIARLNPDAGAVCGADAPCGDWTVANVIAGVGPFDGGPVDAGPDSGIHADAAEDSGVHPDAEPADSGVHPDAAPVDGGTYNNTYFATGTDFQYLELDPVPPALNLLQNFTICMAVRNRGDYAPPVSRWAGGNQMIWVMGRFGGSWAVGIEVGGQGLTGPVVVDNTWTHACVLFQGASSAVWINGTDQTISVNGPPPNPITDRGLPLRILGENPFFNNTMSDVDSVAFYNTILSQSQMDAHRCVFTSIVGGNPCTGQTLTDVVTTPGFVEAYLFDVLGNAGLSYTGLYNMTAVNGGPGQSSSPLP
jgi:hypothetical protein